IGMAAAIDWVSALDRNAVQHAEEQLLALGRSELEAIHGVQVLSAAGDNVGIVTFTMDGAHPHDVASLLDQDGVCVLAGHHCTQPLHRRLGVSATVRASIAAYTSADDIAALAASVRRVTQVFA